MGSAAFLSGKQHPKTVQQIKNPKSAHRFGANTSLQFNSLKLTILTQGAPLHTIRRKFMTQSTTIRSFLNTLSELEDILDDCYWEASTLVHKDRIYNLISLIRCEASELNKLSVQDHHYPYEPVTSEIRELKEGLHFLQGDIKNTVLRTKTALELERLIAQLATLRI